MDGRSEKKAIGAVARGQTDGPSSCVPYTALLVSPFAAMKSGEVAQDRGAVALDP